MQEYAYRKFAFDAWRTPDNARTVRADMPLKDREIGERLAALRQAKGNPPQEVVAHRLGVAHRSYQAWEAGATKPSWRNLSKLAEFYGVSEEWILIGDQPAEPVASTASSQLDRIEEKLDEILALIREDAEGVVARAAGPLLEAAESPDPPTPAQPPTPQAAERRKCA